MAVLVAVVERALPREQRLDAGGLALRRDDERGRALAVERVDGDAGVEQLHHRLEVAVADRLEERVGLRVALDHRRLDDRRRRLLRGLSGGLSRTLARAALAEVLDDEGDDVRRLLAQRLLEDELERRPRVHRLEVILQPGLRRLDAGRRRPRAERRRRVRRHRRRRQLRVRRRKVLEHERRQIVRLVLADLLEKRRKHAAERGPLEVDLRLLARRHNCDAKREAKVRGGATRCSEPDRDSAVRPAPGGAGTSLPAAS